MNLKSDLKKFTLHITLLYVLVSVLLAACLFFYLQYHEKFTSLQLFAVILSTFLPPFILLQLFTIKKLKMVFQQKIKAEKTAVQKENKLALLLENIQTGVVRITQDPPGKFIECNTFFTKTTGYTKNELAQLAMGDIFIDEREKETFFNTLNQTGSIKNETFEIKTKHGEAVIVSITGNTLRNSGNNRNEYLLTITGAGDQKDRLEEMLKNEKLKSIGILAGGIAHDFNNILTGLYGNIALAKLEIDPSEEAFQMIQDAEQSMTKATDLTHQLLIFARGGDPIKETIDINHVIKDAASFNLSGSKITLITNIDEHLHQVHADKDQIGQVISNLVINARQAMPDGGTLRLNAQNLEIKENDVTALSPGKYIKIILQDEGVGIPQDYIHKIFDPYFTTKQAGSGMGLATSYSILKKHNGLITVSSTIGNGASFYVYLPAFEITKDMPARVDADDTSSDRSANILIMDDDEQVCNIARKMIHRFGYTVSTVSDGSQAIRSYKKALEENNKFDLVLMDLTIPGGLGGRETIPKILEIDRNAKAVVISGYSNDPVLANFQDYGFKGMLVKPFKISELKAVLDKVL